MHECKRYTGTLSDPEVKSMVEELSTSAKESRRLLQDRIALYGDLFMSRWRKRSKDKRVDLLTRACSDLPERPNTVFQVAQSNGGRYYWKLSRTPMFRFAALLPYLTIAALKDNPALIFALLHVRTEYTLDDWATFDMHQLGDPWKVGLFAVEFSSLCIIAHGGGYGDVVPFESNAAHRGDILGFPRARLLLEAQSRLMGFLLRLFDLTLERANLDVPSSTKWQGTCKEGFRITSDVAQWSQYTNQPFSAPPLFDIEAIINAAELRLNAIGDHLAFIQTDPSYVRRYIQLVSQGDAYKQPSGPGAFAMIDSMICYEVTTLYWWYCAKEEAEHVRDVLRRYSDQIHCGSALPPEYGRALASLEDVLVKQMGVRSQILLPEILQRPGFARYWTVQCLSTHLEFRRTEFKPTANKLWEDPLYWCLANICAKPDQPMRFDHASLFIFLENHLAKSPIQETSRLDEILLNQLSDYAVNHQLLRAVRLHRPRNKAGVAFETLETKSRRVWNDDDASAGYVEGSHIVRGAVLERFYKSKPPTGRKDQSWIEQSKSERGSLRAYWSAVRSGSKVHMNNEKVAPYLCADLDTAYLEGLDALHTSTLNKIMERQAAPKGSYSAPLPLDIPNTSKNFDAPVIRPKTKTRKSASNQISNGSLEEAASNERSESTEDAAAANVNRISTTKRAMDIVSRMFPESDDENASKTTDWDHFVHAMKDVGLEARNATGSAVIFASKVAGGGKIVFHKPHPVPKIDSILIRAMGKRMAKWFGWCRQNFVLENSRSDH